MQRAALPRRLQAVPVERLQRLLRRLRRRRERADAADQAAAAVRGRPLRRHRGDGSLQHGRLRHGLRVGALDEVVGLLEGLRLRHQDQAQGRLGGGRRPRRVPPRGQPGAARAEDVQHAGLHQRQEQAAGVHVQGGRGPASGRERQHRDHGLGRHQEVCEDIRGRLRRAERRGHHRRADLGHPLQRTLQVVVDEEVRGDGCVLVIREHGDRLHDQGGPALQERLGGDQDSHRPAHVAQGHHAHLRRTGDGEERAGPGPR
mmetsp:Transcript_20270/g.55251  ORF Transcript_20270/g.55251 Transcript_20270/m.55251 type:complete len:259 (+) Transcript_20270:340-1116(+)